MFCKIAEDTLTIIGKSLENNNITLEKSYEDDLEITTFRNEVIQVLLNIINNSKDVMKIKEMDDGIIWLNISHNDEMAIFKICDNAGGIPDDILPRIFEPYFTTKEEKGGTGLGLYMSQMIVEKHLKGTIKAQNIDNGLCMRVSIPLNIDKGNLDD
jgi:signal transduction histidine kinase